MVDKDSIKKLISIEQVYELLEFLGAEPEKKNENTLICKTICHNHPHEGSRKLYYYHNEDVEMGIFRCYTECSPATFDIFELIQKIKKGENYSLNKSIQYIIKFFQLENNISIEDDFLTSEILEDWKVLDKYKNLTNIEKKERKIEFKYYDDKILQFLPKPRILDWEKEGISAAAIKNHNICYNSESEAIVIPHYDIDNNLIGIRERTLIKENEIYGKYRPMLLNKKLYNHPLGFSLYNLNNSKNNIKNMKTVIVGEGEKFCLMYESYFGKENDISVAVCGSVLSNYQFNLLLSLGIEEMIIAFDKQFKEISDNEWQKWTKKLTDINNKYSPYVKVSFMFDKNNLLGYKMSPIDCGKETFLKLFKERVVL